MIHSVTVKDGATIIAMVVGTTNDSAMHMSLRMYDEQAKYFANPKMAEVIHSKPKPEQPRKFHLGG